MKQLKSDLAVLDRKITAELAPKHDEKDGEENKPVTTAVVSETDIDSETSLNDAKKSMVADPPITYNYGSRSNYFWKGITSARVE